MVTPGLFPTVFVSNVSSSTLIRWTQWSHRARPCTCLTTLFDSGGRRGGGPAPPPHRARAQERLLRCQGGDTETPQVARFTLILMILLN